MKKSVINSAITAALVSVAPLTNAGVTYYDMMGYFTLLGADGAALLNASIDAKTGNVFQTPISGTMAFDSITGAGTATLVPFDFGDNAPTGPFTATSMNIQAIGDGLGGNGTLLLGNMLFDWNTAQGIPVSCVMDAAGFIGADTNAGGNFADGVLDAADVASYGATPASDGTYVGEIPNDPATGTGPGGFPGYLALGPLPIAMTSYNTTNFAGCTLGDCQDFGTSGVLPLVTDTDPNSNDYTANTGGTIGGNRMQSGPLQGKNVNLEFTKLAFTSFEAGESIPPNCDFGIGCVGQVPVPAAVWLFGSGLLGLIGVARRKKSV